MVTPALGPVLLILALSGCAAPRAGRGDDELGRKLAGRTPGEPRSCLSATAGAGLTFVAPGVLGYRSGDILWINRLGACSNIGPNDTLILEADGGRYCRGDRVRGLAAGSSLPGPICVLGDFVPYRRTG